MFKKKSPLKATRLVKKRRKVLLIKICSIVGGIIVFIGLVAWLTHASFLTVSAVTVEGNVSVDESMIQELALPYLQGNYLWIFSKANRFLYEKDKIQKIVMDKIARVATASLEVNKNTLIITITERAPAYTWCGGLPENREPNACYFLDENGYIFSKAPAFSGNAYVAFYGMNHEGNPIRTTYLNKDAFVNIDKLIKFLELKSIHPYGFLAEKDGTYELYLEQSGKILFKEDSDVEIILSNLDLIIRNTDIFTKRAAELEYIDLRFGNKVYYKFSGDNQVPIEP